MSADKVWDEFNALPIEAQRQAAEFISFLHQRYPKAKPARGASRTTRLSDEPFVGMWKDRSELQDSAEWVRDLRKREWTG